MKRIFSILLGALTLTPAQHSSAEPVNEWLILKEMRTTVHILAEYKTEKAGFVSSCGGVWIGTRHMITANHCLTTTQEEVIEGKNETGTIVKAVYDTIFTSANKEFAGGIIRVSGNQSCDVMVVRTDDPAADHPIIEVRKTDLKIGERVATIGHPGTAFYVHTFGEVSRLNMGLEGISLRPNFNMVDITVGHGNSGGPLFDMNGKLVGVSSAILTTGEASFGTFANRFCLTAMIDEAKKIEKERNIDW